MTGTVTLQSSVPVGIVALRGFTNERSEFLITTIPIVDLTKPAESVRSSIAHFADGGGWRTEVALINPTDQAIHGTIQFLGLREAASYSIAPRSSTIVRTQGVGSAINSGSIRIAPDRDQASPAAMAIFSFQNNGVMVTESAVNSEMGGHAFRI
jgi:hypothetical protein